MSRATDHPSFLSAWDDAARRATAGLPQPVMDAARRSWFDTVAVTTAGMCENCARAAWKVVAPEAACEPAAADAALVLGAASHALDFDDVCMLATCHPSAPPVAALLALLPLAQRHRPELTLSDVLAAYALGTETTLRLGEWLGFRHYALGFHATSTLGTIGCAAAAARLLGLDGGHAHAALAIAASLAAGLRTNFGSDTKPLHVGFAAASGIRAALLARAGAGASEDVWGPRGFCHAFNGAEPPGPLLWRRGGDWALECPGFEHKRFPSCYLTHRLIAGILAIRARRSDVGPFGMADIEVEVARDGTSALTHPQAGNGLQAKFSGPYCAAAAWLDGRVDLASFTDAAVMRPALRAQMARVVLREREAAGETLDTAPVHVTVRGTGWTERITVDWAPGSPADPMTRQDLLAKWRDCARHAGVVDVEATALALLDAPLDSSAAAVLLPLRVALLAGATG